MTEEAAGPRAAGKRVLGLVALEALLAAALLAGAWREHGGGGVERDLLAFGLLLAPAHLRRVLAALGRAPAPPVAWLLLELVSLVGLVTYPVAPWGIALAFGLALVHGVETSLEASDGAAAPPPGWARATTLLLLGLTGLVLAREAVAGRDLSLGRLVLFLPVAAEATARSRDRSGAALFRRVAACFALLGASCVQVEDELAALLPLIASVSTGATAALLLLGARTGAPPAALLRLARRLGAATLFLAVTGLWLMPGDVAGSRGLVGALALLPLPGALAELSPAGSRWRELASRLRRTLVFAGLAWALLGLILLALETRASIGGVDFYYYFVTARDLAAGSSVGIVRYAYFPGVYAFWRAVIVVLGPSLASAQWAYLFVLALDLALVTAIVGRATRSLPAALFAAVWTAVAASHLDLLEACTEPMALLPTLVAVLVWNGARLEGRAGKWRALALGVGLGLSLYARQQAGLLSLGAVSFLISLALAAPARRHGIGTLLLIPLAAVLAFAIGIACEGQGLTPLRVGLLNVSGSLAYQSANAGPARSVLLENVLDVARTLRGVPSFGAAFGLASAVGAAWCLPRAPEWIREVLGEPGEPPRELVGFVAFAGLATLLQATKHPYPHYFLLGAPFFVIASTIAATRFLRRPALRESSLLQVTAIALGALLLARTDTAPACFHAWPDLPGRALAPLVRWQDEPATAADLADLEGVVHPGEDLLVWPPGKNVVHCRLKARSHAFPQGHGWGVAGLSESSLSWQGLDAVLVLEPRGEEEQRSWEQWQGPALLDELRGHGFEETARLRRMVLWRKAR